MWQAVLVVLIAVAAAVRVTEFVAVRRALLDRPNERSSHKSPVPRLGGAAMVPVLSVAAWLLWPDGFPVATKAAFFGGVVALYTVGLWDDLRPLPSSVRFIVQFAVAFALIVSVRSGASIGTPLALGLVSVWIVAMVNIYNFMDGIDGLAGLQGLVAATGWFIAGAAVGSTTLAVLGMLTAAACVGFLTLNWPPARIFLGDAGSTVLGFIFSALPVLALAERGAQPTGDPSTANTPLHLGLLVGAAALFLLPFAIDGASTLGRRLARGENIFKAHRSHVYQRLIITGLPHQAVTLCYGALAMLGSCGAIFLLRGERVVGLAVACVGLIWFAGLWVWAARREHRRQVESGQPVAPAP